MTPQRHRMCLFFSFQAGVRGVKVEQSPSVLSLQEGANSTLWCNFSAAVTSVQWFQQNPRGSLISLFFIASGMKQNERLSSTVNSKEAVMCRVLYCSLEFTVELSLSFFFVPEAMKNSLVIWPLGRIRRSVFRDLPHRAGQS